MGQDKIAFDLFFEFFVIIRFQRVLQTESQGLLIKVFLDLIKHVLDGIHQTLFGQSLLGRSIAPDGHDRTVGQIFGSDFYPDGHAFLFPFEKLRAGAHVTRVDFDAHAFVLELVSDFLGF